MKQVVYVTSYSFLNDFIFESQAQNFTVGKAVTGLRKIEEQLIDLCNTGNPLAEKVMAKFQSVVTMNKGLKKAELLGQGTDAREPMDMVLFMNSPATSVDVEKFFSILRSFVEDRPNLLENTLKKLMFIRYNKHLVIQ